MSSKFEIDQLEERIAPSTLAIDPGSAGVSGSDSVSISLPMLGTVSVGVNANDTVNTGGLGLGLPNLPGLGGLL